MIVVVKNQGDFLFSSLSQRICAGTWMFSTPPCFGANATLESPSIDFTQAARVGPSGTRIIENAYAHKKN